MFQLSSPGREGEKLLLEYSRIHDRWQWVAYEGNWNPDNRQFAIRQAVFKTEDRTVLDENGLHTWQMNRNASKSAQPVASEAPDWEGHLVCSTRHVITNNAWHENWDGSKRGMIVPFVTWFPMQWINQVRRCDCGMCPLCDLISHDNLVNQWLSQCQTVQSVLDSYS